MKNPQRTIGITLLAIAAPIFLFGAARIGFLIARASVGLYEALIIAALGLLLFLSSRRR